MAQKIPTPQDEMMRLAPSGTVIAATGPSPTPAAGLGGNLDGNSLGGFDHGYGYGPVPPKEWAAVVNVTAIKTSAGNETYTVCLQESPDGSTWTTISPVVALTAVGALALYGAKSMRFSRLEFALGGTAPSLTYEGYMNPNVGH